jgi:hypothetical protein
VHRFRRVLASTVALAALAGLPLTGTAASAATTPAPNAPTIAAQPTAGHPGATLPTVTPQAPQRDDMQPNIVGGHAPTLNYPAGAKVAVHYDAPDYDVENHFTCGAAQYTGYFFRIAAHCVTDMPANATADMKAKLAAHFSIDAATAPIPTAAKKFWMRIGSDRRDEGGTVVAATIFWVHPGWNWGMGKEGDDVALIQATSYVDGYALPIAPKKVKPGDTVYELGWGITEPDGGGELPTQIRELKTVVINAKNCAPSITTREVCVKNPGGVSGPCYGDSGSPLVVQQDGVLYDAGITSHGLSEGCGDTPGVFTSSPEFTAELYAAMRAKPKPPATTAVGTPIR